MVSKVLLGRFDGKIRNGRVLIPKAFRPFLTSEKLHLFSPEAGCLEVVPDDKLAGKEAKTAQVGVARLEGNGLLVLPQGARRTAGLAGSKVVIHGMVDRIEIWDWNAWKKEGERVLRVAEEVLETITEGE